MRPWLVVPAGIAVLGLIALLAFDLALIAQALAPKPLVSRNLD